MKWVLLVFSLFILHSFCLLGQNQNSQFNPNKKLHQYNYDYWTTHSGLPTNSLLHIYQSRNGYLWLSSYGGLIRFDGYKFTNYNKKNTEVFSNNITGRIAEDTNGNLWVTTQESGLISMHNGVFERHGQKEGVNQLFRALLIDRSNVLWSASPKNGWFNYKNGVFSFIKYHKPLNKIEVRAICEGENGEIYFGTLGEGLFKYENGQLTQISYNKEVSSLWIYSIFLDKRNTLWIGTSEGLKTFNGKTVEDYPINPTTTVNAISEDKNENIWLGTMHGIFRINKNKNSTDFIGYQYLDYSFVNDLTFDLEDNLWLTHYKGGLTQCKDGNFTNYSHSSGLNGKVVNAICEIEKNKFLIGFDNGMLNLLDNGIIRNYKTHNNLDNKRVRHIQKDSKNNIWISTYNGLLKIKPNGKEVFYNSLCGFQGSKIRLTFEDNEGNIWIGTRNNGVIKLQLDGTKKYFNVNNGLSSMLIMSINQGINNNIYIGTNDGGVNIIKDDSVIKIINQKNGLPTNIVFNTYHDTLGNIWVAMSGGLVCIYNDTIRYIDVKNGMADDSPFNIIEDNEGNFWLPSISGVMKMNKNEILEYFNNPKNKINCRLFNNNDGMQQDECNATAQSIKATDGSILFSTIDGVEIINPSLNSINQTIPNVIIEKLKVNGIPVKIKNNIQISPGKKRLTFEYTSLSLCEPKKNQFKYRLDGYENNWVNSYNERSVSYTNLPPGYYTFNLIGSNNDGIWNTEGDSISFYIKPLFVQTNIFYALIFLFVFLVGYSLYKYRVKQYKKNQKLLEKKVELRTQEITNKNRVLEDQKKEILDQTEELSNQKQVLEEALATKDKMFSIVAHDLRGPMGNFKEMLEQLVKAPELYDDKKRNLLLGILAKNAKNTFSLLENLLNWSKAQIGVISYNPTKIEINKEISQIVNLVKSMADKKHITIKTSFENNTLALADAEMVKTILRNLIMNAIKFTNTSGSIQISTVKKESFIEICVKDNGVGIKPEIQKKLFNNQNFATSVGTSNEIGSGLGLLLCKDFTEYNGGSIWVESTENKGSSFYFTLKTVD